MQTHHFGFETVTEDQKASKKADRETSSSTFCKDIETKLGTVLSGVCASFASHHLCPLGKVLAGDLAEHLAVPHSGGLCEDDPYIWLQRGYEPEPHPRCLRYSLWL